VTREFKDGRSPHQKIAADLRRRITRGALPPGAKHLSTAELTARYGNVAHTTGQKALSMLKAEELLEGIPDKGVIVRRHAQQSIAPLAFMTPAASGEPYSWMTDRGGEGPPDGQLAAGGGRRRRGAARGGPSARTRSGRLRPLGQARSSRSTTTR
jgi:DNA-binding transcriptional regulator YhcF (GntR family)